METFCQLFHLERPEVFLEDIYQEGPSFLNKAKLNCKNGF